MESGTSKSCKISSVMAVGVACTSASVMCACAISLYSIWLDCSADSSKDDMVRDYSGHQG